MKFLKIIGWIFVPYIMVVITWRKSDWRARSFGVIWSIIVILSMRFDQQSGNQIAATTSANAIAATPIVHKTTLRPKPKQPTPLVPTGTPTMVGKLDVTVTSFQEAKYIGDGITGDQANGEFWIVGVRITNDDNQPRTIDDSMFQITQDNGDTYGADSSAEMDVQNNNVLFDSINPGVSVRGYIVFDMPNYKTSSNVGEHYRLSVSSGIGLFNGLQTRNFSMDPGILT